MKRKVEQPSAVPKAGTSGSGTSKKRKKRADPVNTDTTQSPSPKLPFSRSKHMLSDKRSWGEPEFDTDVTDPDHQVYGSGEEARKLVIALFEQKMEECPLALQADLRDLSEKFGYGKKEKVKEKDLISRLMKKGDSEALDWVAEYVIIKMKMFRELLQLLVMSWDWNVEVAKCVFSATSKFKQDFFAEDPGLEEIHEATESLLELEKMKSWKKNEWVATNLYSDLRMLVVRRFACVLRISTIIERCLPHAPAPPAFLEVVRYKLKVLKVG